MDSRIDRARLGDLLEIQRLKGLYFYNLDHKKWAEWGALFTADARLLAVNDLSEGIDDILKYVIGKLATPKSVHHGHTPLIEFDGNDAARGIWAMADIIDLGQEGVFYGYGHYRETYRRDAGVWKFSYVHLTRLREEIVPARTAST
jgi:hypothetical protein